MFKFRAAVHMVCGSVPDQVSSGSDWICSSLSPYHPSCVLEVKFQSLTLPWHFCLRLLRVLDGSEELWPTVPQSTPDLINIVLFLSKIKTKKERKKERKKQKQQQQQNPQRFVYLRVQVIMCLRKTWNSVAVHSLCLDSVDSATSSSLFLLSTKSLVSLLNL